MNLRKRLRNSPEVHTGALNDILFILLLFFLIGGVFLDSPMRTDPPFKIEQTVK